MKLATSAQKAVPTTVSEYHLWQEDQMIAKSTCYTMIGEYYEYPICEKIWTRHN